MVHTQAFFCHSSLGSRIYLKELSIAQHKKSLSQNENSSTQNEIALEGLEGGDLALIFSYYTGGSLGWAPNNVACDQDDWWKYAFIKWNNGATESAWVRASYK